MRRALGRGRGGPGLLGTAARTAVIAGTATAVSGRVAAAQQGPAPSARQPAPEPAPAAPAPLGVDELYTQLTKLADLRQAGLLTEEEFAAQKARLLAP
jgi:Short C-terminal domain